MSCAETLAGEAIGGYRLKTPASQIASDSSQEQNEQHLFPVNHFVFSFGRCVVTKFLPVGTGSQDYLQFAVCYLLSGP